MEIKVCKAISDSMENQKIINLHCVKENTKLRDWQY